MNSFFDKKQSKKQKVNQDAIDEFQYLLFDALNSTATKESIVTHPKFCKAFEFAIDHDQELKQTTQDGWVIYPHLSCKKMVAIKRKSIEQLFSCAKEEIVLRYQLLGSSNTMPRQHAKNK